MKQISFARKFLKAHPRHGEETHFVEKIWANDDAFSGQYIKPLNTNLLEKEFKSYQNTDFVRKGHTIRANHRWNPNDHFDATCWWANPYNSPVIIFAKDIIIHKTYDFSIRKIRSLRYGAEVLLDGSKIASFENGIWASGIDIIETIAKNDGLSIDDFTDWFGFNSDFDGQIIIWDPEITY